MADKKRPLVAVVMGSSSDMEVMGEAIKILDMFEIPFEHKVLSAHRTPDWIPEFTDHAARVGVKVIIAGAGGAAHLPGIVAAHTFIPVLGVAIGADAVSSVLLMPGGVPVATFGGKGGSKNAALFAARMLVDTRPRLLHHLAGYAETMIQDVTLKQQPALDAYVAQLIKKEEKE